MADVAAGPTPPRPRGRGQLILVTALGLAILFVTLALILNTAIYTENLATRSGDIGGGTDAVRYHDAARDGVGGVMDYVNAHNNSSYAALRANLSAGVDAFRNQSARQFAVGDSLAVVTLNRTVNGTRIAQTDPTRDLTNTSGNPDWTVVQDVEETRAVVINVTDASSLEPPGSANAFNLTLDDGDETWRLNVTNDSTTTFVGVENGTDAEFNCTAPTGTPVIDVTAGTIDGEDCSGLDFAEGLEPPYDISIGHGDNITGTLSMVVNGSTLAGVPDEDLAADGSGQPFAAHAVYATTIDIVYETPRLYYNTTVRVAPGDPDG
ncbi:MAG: hypothetical protein ABEJ92_06220 [Halobacteriales archaeon]